MKKCVVIFALILSLTLLVSLSMAETQEKATAPADSSHSMAMERPRIEGLREFHEVLRPVWHTFLPEGDYKSVREAAPLFSKSVEKIMKGELPSYFQHVKEAFEQKRQALVMATAKLDTVAKGTDDSLLAITVEELHTAYEQLVRVIAPRMMEIESFHLVLYPLWHQALPDSDYAAIKTAMPVLKAKMDTLMSAPVPEWLKDKETAISEKRAALKNAVDALGTACQTGSDADIKIKMTAMHESFRALDGVFE